MKWRSMKTAPKDGQAIILDIGYPFSVVGCWNAADDQWSYASQQVELYNGKWEDTYFETDYANEKDAKGWIPMPKIKGEV